MAALLQGAGAVTSTRIVVEPPAGRTADLLDLTPGYPSTRRLNGRGWTAAWRSAANGPIPHAEPPLQGTLALRTRIAEHLRHARGVIRTAADIMVTAGTSEALGLAALALREHAGAAAGQGDGIGRVPLIAVETPGYPAAASLSSAAFPRFSLPGCVWAIS